MRVLVDTNVLIDYLVGREPFCEAADKIIRLCAQRKISGYMAAHSICEVIMNIQSFKNGAGGTNKLNTKGGTQYVGEDTFEQIQTPPTRLLLTISIITMKHPQRI